MFPNLTLIAEFKLRFPQRISENTTDNSYSYTYIFQLMPGRVMLLCMRQLTPAEQGTRFRACKILNND